MLTESRKRKRSCGSEEGQLPPLAKRSGGGQAVFPELGRDVWDSEVRGRRPRFPPNSPTQCTTVTNHNAVTTKLQRYIDVSLEESSSSDSSGISSPEQTAGGSSWSHSSPSPSSPANPAPASEEWASVSLGSYHHINRILREAHFSSLQTRSQPRAT